MQTQLSLFAANRDGSFVENTCTHRTFKAHIFGHLSALETLLAIYKTSAKGRG